MESKGRKVDLTISYPLTIVDSVIEGKLYSIIY